MEPLLHQPPTPPEVEDNLNRSTKKVKRNDQGDSNQAVDAQMQETAAIENQIEKRGDEIGDSRNEETLHQPQTDIQMQGDETLWQNVDASAGYSQKHNKEAEKISVGDEDSGQMPNSPAKRSYSAAVKGNRPKVYNPPVYFNENLLELDGVQIMDSTVEKPYPHIKIKPEYKQVLESKWKDAIILKLLGRSVSFTSLVARLTYMWGLCDDFELIDLGHNCFIFTCEREDVRIRVLSEGPWIINGCYLVPRMWIPGFIPSKDKLTSTVTWVRIDELSTELCNEACLFSIAKLIGKPVKVDFHTYHSTRGRFVRLCVEIDCSKPLLTFVDIDDTLYKVEYENMPLICYGCGTIGHRKEACPKNEQNMHATEASGEGGKSAENQSTKQPPKTVEEPWTSSFGPWMQVCYNKKKKPNQAYNQSGYMALTTTEHQQVIPAHIWRKLWNVKVPNKIKLFCYLLCHGRILTNAERLKRKFCANDVCDRCNAGKEDLNHLFRECNETKAIWLSSPILRSFVSQHSSFQEWFIQNLTNDESIRMDGFVGKKNVLFAFTLWQIWKDRNLFVFEKIKNRVKTSCDSIFYLAKEFIDSNANVSCNVQKGPQWVAWFPPNFADIKVNTDASCTNTNNEGEGNITIGGVFRDKDGNWIRGFMGSKGRSNIFNGELLAIREALSIALDYGINSLEVETDCMGAVTVITSDYIPDILSKAVINDIREMKKKFWKIIIGWRPREANRAADFMAGLARRMEDLGVNVTEDAPTELENILDDDRRGHVTPRF